MLHMKEKNPRQRGILDTVGCRKCDFERNAIRRRYFNKWKVAASELGFLMHLLAFASVLGSYPEGPGVGRWPFSLSLCSAFSGEVLVQVHKVEGVTSFHLRVPGLQV